MEICQKIGELLSLGAGGGVTLNPFATLYSFKGHPATTCKSCVSTFREQARKTIREQPYLLCLWDRV